MEETKGVIYKRYLKRERPARLVIRLRDRDLIHKGKRKNCLEMAKVLPTPYETTKVVYEDGREKRRKVQYNAAQVRLPGYENRLYLVVVKGFGIKPMMLLTSCQVNRKKKEGSLSYRRVLPCPL